MERIFAPWRMEYVTGLGDGGCFLCDALAAEDDSAHLVVARAPTAFVILNRYPYNAGHLMVAPVRHVADLVDLSPGERSGVMDLVAAAVAALRASMRPDGFNLGVNLGRVAGAGLPGHVHVHVVPRWDGDTNFMTTTGGTKVIPESLDATWERLRGAFAAEE